MSFAKLQTKVFSRWVSKQLKGLSEQQVNDITKDLTNGIALIDLATILTHKKSLKQYNQMPKRNIDMIQNCDLAINMFTKDGVNLSGITGKNINENNEKLILGFIWSLITHYSVNKSMNSEKSKNNQKDNSKLEKENQNSLIS